MNVREDAREAIADEHCDDSNGCHIADMARFDEYVDFIEEQAVNRYIKEHGDHEKELATIIRRFLDEDGSVWHDAETILTRYGL